MSHIANALDRELKQSKKTAADLSRASGVNSAQISRIKSGEQTWVSPKDLVSLARGLAPGDSETTAKCHARLLYARLQDECSGPGSKYITLAMAEVPPCIQTRQKPILPPASQRHMDTIAQNITTNRQIRDLIQTIANLCKNCTTHKTPPTPQARAKRITSK